MKNSTSKKRGSIIKSIDKLTSSIVADEEKNNNVEANTTSAALM
jgi:hypothetical protein